MTVEVYVPLVMVKAFVHWVMVGVYVHVEKAKEGMEEQRNGLPLRLEMRENVLDGIRRRQMAKKTIETGKNHTERTMEGEKKTANSLMGKGKEWVEKMMKSGMKWGGVREKMLKVGVLLMMMSVHMKKVMRMRGGRGKMVIIFIYIREVVVMMLKMTMVMMLKMTMVMMLKMTMVMMLKMMMVMMLKMMMVMMLKMMMVMMSL